MATHESTTGRRGRLIHGETLLTVGCTEHRIFDGRTMVNETVDLC